MIFPDLGIRLQLLIGSTVQLPVPQTVIEALVRAEVRKTDQGRDVFDLIFNLSKTPLLDYDLLRDGLVDPPNRVIIMVFVGVLPHVLMDGIITRHELLPNYRSQQTQLKVTGEDISIEMDYEERSETHPNQPDSVIVSKIVASYGLVPEVTTTTDVPIELDRVPTQQESDLRYIQRLARRNSFVFFIDPTNIPGLTKAYWGPERRTGLPQPPLNMDMGPFTNVNHINFGFDALRATNPRVSISDPFTGTSLPIPAPDSLLPSLTSQPAQPLRTTVARNTANRNSFQAALQALIGATAGSGAIDGSGELHTIRYGHVLTARKLIGVRGAGKSYDGTYYIKGVTHFIRRGEYKQGFTLTREGRGATSDILPL
jgi:hypothetical protein